MDKKAKVEYIIRNIIFFFNMLLAFLIISGAQLLIRTQFGKAALGFGFFMLALTTALKLLEKW